MTRPIRATLPGVAAWRGFVRRYGWRAYAVVVLAVVTVAVAVHGTPRSAATASAPTDHRPAQQHAGAADFVAPHEAPAPVTVATVSDSTACADNTEPRLALVSLHEQRAWMCDGPRQVYTTPVTTGASVDGDQTPTGSWRVQARERDRYLVGPGYRDYVNYWVPFNGDFGFHDATWQTMAFGSPDYITHGSHGCVHLPMPAMTWFYRWAEVGTTVVTVEA